MTYQPKTGDALLASGTTWINFIIRLFTGAWGKWSHAASVVVHDDVVWVYEVTTQCNRPDAYFNDTRDGSRLELYKNWLAGRKGKVWVGRLSAPLTIQQAKKFRKHWQKLHLERVSYDVPGAIFSALPGTNKRQLKKTFCSAAHVSALVAAGRMAPRTNYAEYHPHDVAQLPIYLAPVRLK